MIPWRVMRAIGWGAAFAALLAIFGSVNWLAVVCIAICAVAFLLTEDDE